ncbi:MAG: OsmC family protein [Bacteroidetes bacterium]|nr:OsmC family protein [Bacteroidota bacterium]
MPTIEGVYTGGLRTRLRHVRSGNEIITDAPVDNQGKGEAFSPTDLLAASLGSCMLTLMGIAATKHDIDIDGTTVKITKIMAESPRRVSEIIINMNLPHDKYSDEEKTILLEAARNCPVSKSLNAGIRQVLEVNYGG